MINVHSVESLGTFDGPGIRLVFFLQGCNFKCLYCSNPDTIEKKTGRLMTTTEVLQMARNQRPFFGEKGGVTVSGGEPLLQARELLPVFKALKADGFNTCVDTNGASLSASVKELLDYTDLVLLDIKQIEPKAHEKIAGTKNLTTLKFASYLQEIGKPTWIRYVLVPGYTDKEEHLQQLGLFVQNMQNVERIDILPYHKLGKHKYEALGWDYQLEQVELNSKENIERAKNILLPYGKVVLVN
ncbi:MAG TPA: pyruvate formate lyase-activating protein [Bacteroidales bacterium]|nr:pyruvate formate lyase-activating protein [Bacteroidales bacterium]